MKKVLMFVLTCSLLCANLLPVHAATPFGVKLFTEEYSVSDSFIPQPFHVIGLADGTVLLETTPVIINRGSGNLTAQKVYYKKDGNNNNLWSATLTGTFTYNGSTSSCTAASCTTTIYNSAWSEQSVNAYTSGASANADVTMVRKFLFITVETVSIFLTMSCDKDGNVY
jgi:hypothetical protein